jgi:phospholipid transport system substrate-binding protein
MKNNLILNFFMKGALVAALFFASAVNTAFAAASPLPMLEQTSQQMLSELKQDKPRFQREPDLINQLVRRILLPHVDLATMSRSVLGRDAWSKASPAERQQFTNEFVTLLIRTYSSALSAYNDQKVEFSPLRGSPEGQSRIQVESRIVRSDGPSIPLNYRLLRQGQDWKVYDFSVEGVSMVESFRNQFAEQLSQGGGMTQLLQKMKQHNQESRDSND